MNSLKVRQFRAEQFENIYFVEKKKCLIRDLFIDMLLVYLGAKIVKNTFFLLLHAYPEGFNISCICSAYKFTDTLRLVV